MQPANGHANTNGDVIANGDGSHHHHRGRTLILCFDGTSNEYDRTNTVSESIVMPRLNQVLIRGIECRPPFLLSREVPPQAISVLPGRD